MIYSKITYKNIVETYYQTHYDSAFSLLEGENAPKLGKQIKKQLGFEESQKTLQAFQELKTVFEEIVETGELYWREDEGTELLDEDDAYAWAFNGSCNKPGNDYGGNTIEFFRRSLPEMNYMRVYVKDVHAMRPALRAYFVKVGENFGHAGGYLRAYLCKGNEPENFYTTLYSATTLLLNYLYFDSQHLFEDLTSCDGLCIPMNETAGVWANIGYATCYGKFESIPGLMIDLGEIVCDSLVYCDNSEKYLWEDDDNLVYSEYNECHLDLSYGYVVYSEILDQYFWDTDSMLEYLEVTFY